MLIAPFAGLFDLYAINPRCHSSPPLAFFTGAEEHRALAYVGALNQTKHHSDSLSEIWTASAFGTSPSVKSPKCLNGMPCQLIQPTAVGASARAYRLPRLHILPHFESFSEQHNSRIFLSDVAWAHSEVPLIYGVVADAYFFPTRNSTVLVHFLCLVSMALPHSQTSFNILRPHSLVSNYSGRRLVDFSDLNPNTPPNSMG
ncbi:hypothetical protein B0H13DRAFT_2071374 [Mycena leptocephala]|nr:hypothetical protein B0H13DRAFT_2071374 [Mycena leptocephala]